MIDFIKNQNFHRNLSIDELVDYAVTNNEGVIGLNGALMVDTGEFSGRIPKDKSVSYTHLRAHET